MSEAFRDLSPEGRMQKIRQHVSAGHPVPSYWVEWLLEQMDRRNEPGSPGNAPKDDVPGEDVPSPGMR